MSHNQPERLADDLSARGTAAPNAARTRGPATRWRGALTLPGALHRLLAGLAALVIFAALAGALLLVRPPSPGRGALGSVAPSGASPSASAPGSAAPSSLPETPAPSSALALTAPFTAGGFTWQPLPVNQAGRVSPWPTPSLLARSEFVGGVEKTGHGFVAVGTAPNPPDATSTALAWYLPLDGSGWKPATVQDAANATMGGLFVAQDGILVAYGEDGYSGNTQMIDTQGTALWTSAAGRSWTRVPTQASLVGGLIEHVVQGNGTFVAVGTAPVGTPRIESGTAGPPIWTSTDGVSWSRVGPASVFPSGGRLVLNGIVWTGSRFVAAGVSLGAPQPLAWTSPDGRDWAATDMASTYAQPVGGGEPAGLARVGSLLVAVGMLSNGGATDQPAAWESADGGIHWTLVPMPSSLDGVILQSIENVNGAWTVTGSVFDTGARVAWTLTSTAPPPPVTAPAALAFFDAENGLLVGSTGPNGSGPTNGVVWRTSDGGRHWTVTRLDLPPLDSVAVVASSDAWAAGTCPHGLAGCRSGVFASTDGGRTWGQVSSLALSSLSFVDPEHGWAVGPPASGAVRPAGPRLFATQDGGRTWLALGDPCSIYGSLAGVSFTDRLHGWVGCGYVAGAGNSAAKAVFATSDGGRTWQLRAGQAWNGPQPVGSITLSDYLAGLQMRSDGVGVIWQSRGIDLRSSDGGRIWTPTPPGQFDAVLPSGFWLLDDTHWLALEWGGNQQAWLLVVSNDGGRTWTTRASFPITASAPPAMTANP